jgi:hypothetical protein
LAGGRGGGQGLACRARRDAGLAGTRRRALVRAGPGAGRWSGWPRGPP